MNPFYLFDLFFFDIPDYLAGKFIGDSNRSNYNIKNDFLFEYNTNEVYCRKCDKWFQREEFSCGYCNICHKLGNY